MSQNDRKKAASFHDERIATNDEFPLTEVERSSVNGHADLLDAHPQNDEMSRKIFRGDPRKKSERITVAEVGVVDLEDWE